MFKFFALVSKNTYLLVASCEIENNLSGGLEVIKACGKKGFSLSRRHFIDKEQRTEADCSSP
jgi:hypothetical protein